MEQEVVDYYEKLQFGELITITKTGIINIQQILIDPKCDQLIHSGKLRYKYYTRLSLISSDNDIQVYEETDISFYNAVYYNGVQLVRKGKLYY